MAQGKSELKEENKNLKARIGDLEEEREKMLKRYHKVENDRDNIRNTSKDIIEYNDAR